MIAYLEMFWTFFKIGLFTFGGGYAMIPIIQSEVVSKGWLANEQMIQYIAISESTPGPLAINMATLVGASQLGLLGSLIATLGVVLPSFIIILIIASIFVNFTKNKYVKAALRGMQPIIIGLISVTGVIMVIHLLFPNMQFLTQITDFRAFAMLFNLALLYFGYKKYYHKNLSPITLLLVAAGLGIIVYSI